ncbi:unnamed protein product [Closterium sp. NIES-54]
MLTAAAAAAALCPLPSRPSPLPLSPPFLHQVLVDEEQRALYDRFGVAALSRDFMAGRGGTERKGAAWEAFDTWDEFQPFQRKTRKGDARQAAAARWSSDSGSEGEGEAVRQVVEAVTGDVVEYPLSAAVRDRFHDGRIKGVGFVVGYNKGALLPCLAPSHPPHLPAHPPHLPAHSPHLPAHHPNPPLPPFLAPPTDRGDRHKLPPENLGLVEIEPLFQEAGEDVWQTDALESAAFASLPDLRVLRTVSSPLPAAHCEHFHPRFTFFAVTASSFCHHPPPLPLFPPHPN